MPNRVLLTGAGFTHNFGGMLASDVSAKIYSLIKANKLKILLEKTDFEDAYQTVIESDEYNFNEKNELNTAIKSVFEQIDSASKDGLDNINTIFLRDFISWFGNPDESGFIFTLNQDTFMETHKDHFLGIAFDDLAPGSTISDHNLLLNPFDQKTIRVVTYENFEGFRNEKEKGFGKRKNHVFYIKLHGSHNWVIKDTPEQLMVIGRDKINRLTSNTLLNWYFDIFQTRIARNDTKLLIIGYGFNDHHINETICKNANIKIYVINPEHPKNFFKTLTGKPFGNEIKKLIHDGNYYDTDLPKLIGNGKTQANHYWQQLQFDFFDRNKLSLLL